MNIKICFNIQIYNTNYTNHNLATLPHCKYCINQDLCKKKKNNFENIK